MLIDPNHPFFRPLWVRVLCVAAPLLWGAVEFRTGATAWGIMFSAAGLYLLYELFLKRGDAP